MNLVFNKYHFAPIYVPLLKDKASTVVLYGSRNSGKSLFACQRMVIKCLTQKKFKCLMVRKLKERVKDSLYDTIVNVIKIFGLEQFFTFKEHERKIVCVNGNSFIPMGLYESSGSSGNAKSVTDPTDAIVDELDECTEDEFEKLWMSLRGSETSQIFVIFNTHRVDESHWIFERWFPERETFEKLDGSHTYVKSKRKRTTILHTTYLMNPFVTQKKLDDFEEQKEHAYHRYEISGLGLIKVIKQKNLALKAFDRFRHVSEVVKFNPDALVYECWDFNRLPHHTVSCWQFGGYDATENVFFWNLFREYCLEDHSVKEVQQQINKDLKSDGYSLRRVSISCDYSGYTKRDHGATSDINKIKSELKRGGFEVDDKTIVNTSVIDSLDFVNDIFDEQVTISDINPKYGGSTIKIRIHPDCKFHIADFEKTKTDFDGKILKVKQKNQFIEDGIKVNRTFQARGHGVDNTRYMATTVFPFEYDKHRSSNR